MRIIGYNIVAVCFIALAAYCIYLKTDGWGWCILGAILTAVTPQIKDK